MDPYVHMAVEIKRLFLYLLRYGIIYKINNQSSSTEKENDISKCYRRCSTWP